MLDYQINESISRAYTESVCGKGKKFKRFGKKTGRGRNRSVNETSTNMLGVEPIDLVLYGNNAPITLPSFHEPPSISAEEHRNAERKRAEEAEARRVASLTPEQRAAEEMAQKRARYEFLKQHIEQLKYEEAMRRRQMAAKKEREYYASRPVMTAGGKSFSDERPRATISAGPMTMNSAAYKSSRVGSPDQMLGDGVNTGLALAAPGGAFAKGGKFLGRALLATGGYVGGKAAGKGIKTLGKKYGNEAIEALGEDIEENAWAPGFLLGRNFVPSVVGNAVGNRVSKRFGLDDGYFGDYQQYGTQTPSPSPSSNMQFYVCPDSDCHLMFPDQKSMAAHYNREHGDVDVSKMTNEQIEKAKQELEELKKEYGFDVEQQ